MFNILKRIRVPDEYGAPDEFILQKIKTIPENGKIALLAALVFSILIHGVIFVNRFVNADSIGYLSGGGFDHLVIGRWLSPILRNMRGDYNIPWIIMIFAIVFLCLSVAFTVVTLELNKKLNVIICAFLMVAFPTIADSFSYDFMADVFTLSLFFSVCSIYFSKKYKFGFVLGSLFLMLSLSLFQAYIAFAAGLSLILIVKQLFAGEDLRKVFRIGINYGLTGICGSILYLISVRVSLWITGAELSIERYTDTLGRIPLDMLFSLIRTSYINFLLFFTEHTRFFPVTPYMQRLYIVALLLAIFFLLRIIIVRKIYKKPIAFTLSVISLASMPLAFNAVGVLTTQGISDALTIYSFVLSVIFVLVLREENHSLTVKKPKISSFCALIVVFLIAIGYLFNTGLFYFQMHIDHERTFAFYNRVLARIEAMPDFRKDLPVALIGDDPLFIGHNPPRHTFAENINFRGELSSGMGAYRNTRRTSNLGQRRRPLSFISDYLGVHLHPANLEQVNYVIATDTFQSMPIWPHPDSVAIINDVIVVKLNPAPVVSITYIYSGTLAVENRVPNLPGYFLYDWLLVDDQTRTIEYIEFTSGLDSFEFIVTEPGRYRVRMRIQTPDGRMHMNTHAWSDWVEVG